MTEAYEAIVSFAARVGWQTLSVVIADGVPFLAFDGGVVALGTILTMTEKQ